MEVGEYSLVVLYKEYQSKGIKDVCNDCNGVINEALRKVNLALYPIKVSWVKKIINKLKNPHNEPI